MLPCAGMLLTDGYSFDIIQVCLREFHKLPGNKLTWVKSLFSFLLFEFGFMLYKVHLLPACKQTRKGHLKARVSAVKLRDIYWSSVEETTQRQTHASHRNGLIHAQQPSLRRVISDICKHGIYILIVNKSRNQGDINKGSYTGLPIIGSKNPLRSCIRIPLVSPHHYIIII